MCANNRAAICPECDTQPVAKPRSGNRVRVVSHATRLVKARLKSGAHPSRQASPSPRAARRAPAARVVLTKPAHRQIRHSRSRPGKVPSTGEWEVVKS
jgi:hypothetical protein